MHDDIPAGNRQLFELKVWASGAVTQGTGPDPATLTKEGAQ